MLCEASLVQLYSRRQYSVIIQRKSFSLDSVLFNNSVDVVDCLLKCLIPSVIDTTAGIQKLEGRSNNSVNQDKPGRVLPVSSQKFINDVRSNPSSLSFLSYCFSGLFYVEHVCTYSFLFL